MSNIRAYYSFRHTLQWAATTLRLAAIDLTYGWLNVLQLLRSMLTGGTPFIVEVRRSGHRFKVISAVDVWTIDEIFVRGEYAWDRVRLSPDATIIDIGANIGGFAVWAGWQYPRSMILAYEPYPGNYDLLRENLSRNGISNVRAFPLAVWGRPATVCMDTSLPYASMYSTSEPLSINGSGLRVAATSLDAIFEDHHLTCCDLLKVDCEGAEYEIMLNVSPGTLKRIRVILMEYHDNRTVYTHADLETHLRGHGFEVEVKPNPAITGAGYLFAANVDLAD